MKIEITEKTIVCGKVANIGDVFDSSNLPERDVRVLLCIGKAKRFEGKPKVEEATSTPKTETADAAPKKGKRCGK